MDTVEATNEFQEWELLQTNSDTEAVPVTSTDSGDSFDAIDSSALIQANYFSSEPHDRCEELVEDGNSVGSDNPNWIDPRLGEYSPHCPNMEPCEFWPDSSSDRSGDQKFSELGGGNELGFRLHEEEDVKSDCIELKGEGSEDLGNYCMESVGIDGDSAETSDANKMDVEKDVNLHSESRVLCEEMNEIKGIESGGGVVDGGAGMKNGGGELEKSGLVWWKMPMEFLKYCMMRMSPVWTVSVAAAFMGFVILWRRLYKMKRKTKGLQIKVVVDDKKASQVMSRAARLNEAFSVVKLVPVIRPSLPAVGSTTSWPTMSLR
ncbi:hypothetical protein AAHA92_33753 [Salvia divinorum]|uniref:DUF6821 domain-containing protein n=1 Tax=Salvia divinorum TaxID=28513 RepID=A0ABD1FQ28_SALDI